MKTSLPFALLFVAGLAAGQGAGGALRGRIEEDRTGVPISGALVEYIDGRTRVRARTTSDSTGAFVLPQLPAGSFRLRVSRLGYTTTLTPYWKVLSGEVLSVTVRILTNAVPVAPLEVSARSRAASPVLEGFRQRMSTGTGGTFMSRDEIRRRNPALITDLFHTVPGVQVQSAPALGRNARVVTFGARFGPGGGACPAQIFLDGVLANRSGAPASLDELASPSGLAGIEIYNGLSTLPPEFLTPDSRCGVIALWTERGDVR